MAQEERDRANNPEPESKTKDMSYLGGASSKDAYLGMELPYLGEGDVRVGFSEYDKMSAARQRDAEARARKGQAAAAGTGVKPRPPPRVRKDRAAHVHRIRLERSRAVVENRRPSGRVRRAP